MKIWIKLLAGGILGVALGLVLSPNDAATTGALSVISQIITNIGRWVIFPLVFFSLAVGTFELRQEKRVLFVYGRLLLYIAAASVILVIFGVITVLIFSPARIPIIDEKQVVFAIPSIKEILFQLFPANLFLVFTNQGNFLLPLYFLSFFIGLNFSFDRLVTKPAVQLFDSFSRIFYHINAFVVEIIPIGMIAFAAYLLLGIRGETEFSLFTQLIIVLVVDTAIIIFGIFPILLYYFGGRENPYRWLYASIASAITGFLSGDAYFSMAMLVRHGKENYGVPRKIGSTAFPFAILFGRVGTAFVSAVSFVVILKSYSSLGVSVFQGLWVVGASFLITFVLGSVPGMGSFVALSVLCGVYGRGMDQGFLILKPIAPLLVSFGVLLDLMCASLISLLVARHENAHKEIEAKDYI